MTEQRAALHIDVYSDVICPWCYVGKRRLERALPLVRNDARVTWRPFQLNPAMPLDGMDRSTYLQAKFGSLETFARLEEQLITAGSGEGIAFAFGNIQRTPNTFAAHRLIWYAERQGKQDAMVEALFHGYFVEGRDIGNVMTLVQMAVQAGLERAEAESFLLSDEGVADVKTDEAAGHRMGIRGVPYVVVNDRYAISGAQLPEAYLSIFKRIAADRAGQTTHR